MKKKTELNEVEKFYVQSKRTEPVKKLAETVGCEEEVVKEYLDSLAPLKPQTKEEKERKKTRAEKLYGNNGKGAIVATEAASQYNDDTREKPKLDQSSFIHRIK